MTNPEELTLAMIQRRNDYRTLCNRLGWDYTGNIEAARGVIRGVANNASLSLTAAALRVAQELHRAGKDPTMVIAALVEEFASEPVDGGKVGK